MIRNNYTGGKYAKKLFIPQRTQPPHIGHISMLEAACNAAEEVVVGIGSANKIGKDNPYSAYERQLMLEKSLEDIGLTNCKFVGVPDFESDEEWMDYLRDYCGLDKDTAIVSGNDYVLGLCDDAGYQTVNPFDLVKKPIDISATRLREMILENDSAWKYYAATGTKYYFEKLGGRDRIARFYHD